MKHKIQRLSSIGLPLALALTGVYLLLTFTAPLSQNLTVAAGPQAVENACGTIASSETWTPDNLYVGDSCDTVVSTGVTLTIQAGTVVKYGGAGSALIVQGNLVVQGTEGAPVAITSLHDDAHGDTAAGSSGTPAAGDWYGIHFAEGSAGTIEHAFIGYAGSGGWNAALGLWNLAQVRVVNAGLAMQHATVDSGLRTGIYLEGTGLTPTFQHVQISNNAGHTTSPYSNAVYQETVNMQPTYSDLTFSGNDFDAVVIQWSYGTMAQNVTLAGTTFSFQCGYTDCPLNIPDGLTLTVAPGTQMSFPAHSYRLLAEAGGTLLAEGTPTQPITFTSILPTPQPGDWQGIVVNTGATARLAHCDVSYGGRNSYGGLDLSATDVEVHDCHIHNHQTDGVYLRAQGIAPSFADVDVTDNGRHGVYFADSDIRLSFEGGSIQRNAQDGVVMHSMRTGNRPSFRDITVNDNGGDGLHFNSHGTAPLVEDVDLDGNGGAAVRFWAGTSPTFRNLSASGNGVDGLVNTGGDIWGGSTWEVADSGLPVYLVGNTNIRGGALLSIEPGTTLFMTPTVSIWNSEGGSLYALGTTERPITFTGAIQTPGSWGYVAGGSDSTLFLSHCTVEYGGAHTPSYGMIDTWGYGPKVVQNSRIRHSLGAGLKMSWGTSPVLINNEIYSNTTYGVLKTFGPTQDARYNWWGHASGPYHPTQNPGGLGDEVGEYENVLFAPWLTAPPTKTLSLGKMIVDTGAPESVSPGQTVDYGIYYRNDLTLTVESAVLLLQLPAAAEYVDSSHSGIFWPERDQVFWKLGDIAPGANGVLSVRVRFYWGLPGDYRDGTITLLAGTNYNSGVLDVASYYDYAPTVTTDSFDLSQAEFDALRAGHPDLETLYQQALSQGYDYVKASQSTFDDGDVASSAVMISADHRYVRVLSHKDTHSLAMTMDGNSLVLQDTTGGMTITVQTMESEYWGNWIPGVAAASTNSPTACDEKRCNLHCVGKKATFKVVSGMAKKLVHWATFGLTQLLDPPQSPVDGIKEITKEVTDCYDKCSQNPLNGCCDADGQVRWSPGIFSGWCTKEYCNATTGTYGTPGQLFCAYGTRCVSGFGDEGGCQACQSNNALHKETTILSPRTGSSTCASSTAEDGDCSDLGLLVGKDPNEKYGPAGDLLPGELVTYTIAYENVGQGRVYGVYVTDQLAEVFDADTLQIQGGGVYLPYDRTLVWMVGELGPKGDTDSQGSMTYTVKLTTGLPSGTVVSNQAVVYFPSVPEETPTNTWVNLVAPLAAIPQDLSTNYMTLLAITLSGREVSGLPLTYEIVEFPRGGTLSGTPPNLTYSPFESFAGADGFTFQVSNGTSTSRAAQVHIDVTSTGDTTAPQVLWTDPANGASDVPAPQEPPWSDESGPAYLPFPAIRFSEAISETTVTTQSVNLTEAGGRDVPISLIYDGHFYQVIVVPRAPLQGATTYTVTTTPGVSDAAGNPLAAAPTSFSFTTQDLTPPEVDDTSPADGAIDVALEASIAVTFTEPISRASLNLVLTPTWETTATWNTAGTVLTATHAPFAETTVYTAAVTARDLAQNPMAAPYTWSFKTQDITPPEVVGTSPADGLLLVELDAGIVITFTEPVSPASLDFALTPDPGGWGTTWNTAGTVVTATHAPFAGTRAYTATVMSGLADLAGNLLAVEYRWHFTTTAPEHRYIYLPLVIRNR